MSYSLPHLHVSGTNYEVGKSIVISFKYSSYFNLSAFCEFAEPNLN